MSKILVTGSRGTLGHPLKVELERRGHEVWQLDLLHAGNDRYFRADVGEFRQLEKVSCNRSILSIIWRRSSVG